ncbi:MAG: ATP-binding protein [Myxococcota bacterium]
MSSSQSVGLRFTQLYVLVLLAIGLLGLVAQSSAQYATVALLSDAHAVNIAGRQRMLSQRVAKGALELDVALEAGDAAAAAARRREIADAVGLFEASHQELVRGTRDAAIGERFDRLTGDFDAVRMEARAVARSTTEPERHAASAALLASEDSFLEGMDALVFALEDASTKRVEGLQSRQAIFFVVQLLALLCAGVVVFRPAVAQLMRALDALDAERRRRVTEVEEVRLAEQARVGRDLHDGLCQELAGIAMLLGTLERKVERGHLEAAGLAPIRTLVADATEHARRLARGLYPAVLEREGLGPALTQLTQDLAVQHPVPIALDLDVHAGLPGTVENTLYRVAQEALSNALRHAEPTEVKVRLLVTEDTAELVVEDDGIGFGPEEVERGMGLDSMRKRADLLGATHEVTGGPGEGTRVLFRVEDPHR